MRFFLSAEVQSEVGDALRHAENKVRNFVIAKLASNYGLGIERWTHITILRPKIPPGWGEIQKYHHDDRVAEFRLMIDYETFKTTTAEAQVQMLLASILRSVDLFPALKVKDFDVARFRHDIVDAAVAGGLMVPSPAEPPRKV